MLESTKCAKCNKVFIPAVQHIYKLRKNEKVCYYCSYTCWRKDGGDNGGAYEKR